MALKIVEFVGSENPSDRAWGEPGDQLKEAGYKDLEFFGGEVAVHPWRGGWSSVWRCIDPAKARSIAETALAVAYNKNVGYSQYNSRFPRTGLYQQLVKTGGRVELIALCNSDCSASTAAYINNAGISISADMWTGNAEELLAGTKKFVRLTGPDFTDLPDYLCNGDILFRPGHTAILVGFGDCEIVAGMCPVGKITADTWLRTEPATSENSKMSVLLKGDLVQLEPVKNGRWWLVNAQVDGKARRGWVSGKNLLPVIRAYTTQDAWIRTQPDLTGAPVYVVKKGAQLFVCSFGEKTDSRGVIWHAVYSDDGFGGAMPAGYMSGKMFKVKDIAERSEDGET